MGVYIVRRVVLVLPVLFAIMAVNFAVTQFVPGGPVQKVIAEMTGKDTSATQRITGEGSSDALKEGRSGGAGEDAGSKYRGARGLDPELIKQIEQQFGFDQPAHERFWKMLKSYAVFDFGRSFFRDR